MKDKSLTDDEIFIRYFDNIYFTYRFANPSYTLSFKEHVRKSHSFQRHLFYYRWDEFKEAVRESLLFTKLLIWVNKIFSHER